MLALFPPLAGSFEGFAESRTTQLSPLMSVHLDGLTAVYKGRRFDWAPCMDGVLGFEPLGQGPNVSRQSVSLRRLAFLWLHGRVSLLVFQGKTYRQTNYEHPMALLSMKTTCFLFLTFQSTCNLSEPTIDLQCTSGKGIHSGILEAVSFIYNGEMHLFVRTQTHEQGVQFAYLVFNTCYNVDCSRRRLASRFPKIAWSLIKRRQLESSSCRTSNTLSGTCTLACAIMRAAPAVVNVACLGSHHVGCLRRGRTFCSSGPHANHGPTYA